VFISLKNKKGQVLVFKKFQGLAPNKAKEIIRDWIAKCNREYVHSALGYLSPLEFE